MSLRFFFALICLLSTAQAVDASDPKLSPALRQLLSVSRKNEWITVLIDLREQLDFEKLARRWAETRLSRHSQGIPVRQALTEIARRSDRRWIPLLEHLQKRRSVQSWSRVTIVNRFIVTARAGAVRALARRNDVAAITEEIHGESALEMQAGSRESAADPTWPLSALEVAAAREAGLDGTGVVVGLIDSGASQQHEQLRDNFRGGANSWFDPRNKSDNPTDTQIGHGTAVLSCAVGRAEHAGLGVAPRATWIAAVGLDRQLYSNVMLTKAADWMLNIGRPDVLIIPWRLPQKPCDDSLRRVVNAWRAAGIVVIFAAGNSGPDAETDVSPANYTHLFPGRGIALSVGAVDRVGQIYEHSSRGPNRCGAEVFPQFVAPGVDVSVAFPVSPTVYRQVSGTSFAAGFAAGGIALLLQQFPDAAVEEIEEAVRKTADDLGAAGPDSVYGFGRMNISKALEFLRAQSKPVH